MARPHLVERFAELLGLQIEVIQAYGKPQERVTAQAPRKVVGTVSKAEPRFHYATLKAVPRVAGAEEVEPARTDENELYAQWCAASDEEKPQLEKRLFNKLTQHAQAVMWEKIPDADKRLAPDIASVVMEHLAKFKGNSKFSTWTHRIILNHCYQYLRGKVDSRSRLYVSENPEEDTKLKDPQAEAAFARVEQGIDLEPLERLVRGLPSEDQVLLDCRIDGMTMVEAAAKLKISEDAAESRLRRLVESLRKEFRRKPDGK
jgi:RNA polymerase sigma factor (sigma-70 family)